MCVSRGQRSHVLGISAISMASEGSGFCDGMVEIDPLFLYSAIAASILPASVGVANYAVSWVL